MSGPCANVGCASLSTGSEVGAASVEEVRREGTVDVLERLHRHLAIHFRDLHEARQGFTPAAPVFALEHGLDDTDLELLKKTVRYAVRQGFGAPFRRWWLPFV